MVKKISIVKNSPLVSGFFKKTIKKEKKIYSKIQCRGRSLRKEKQNSKVEINLKTRLQGMFSLFYDVFWSSVVLKIYIISFYIFWPLIEVILLKKTVSDDQLASDYLHTS